MELRFCRFLSPLIKLNFFTQESMEKMEAERAQMQSDMQEMEMAVSAEAKRSIQDTVEEVVDSELQCIICAELFIKVSS